MITDTRVGAASRWLSTDPADGALPLLLLALTVATGVVDAVSILALGRVFVANMTGNVVFIGFALAGSPGFSLTASLLGLLGFLAGAGVGGRLTSRLGHARLRLLAVGVSTELALVAAATVLLAWSIPTVTLTVRDLAVILLALATGLQNAIVRRLAVPDLTTTVLTMTLTGIAADISSGATHTGAFARRVLAVVTMLAGALCGAVLVIHVNAATALALAAAVIAVVTAFAWRAAGCADAPVSFDAPQPPPDASQGRIQ